MGQKVNPYGMRLGIIRETRSKWFAEGRDYRQQLVEDLQARQTIHKMHRHAAISDIIIERHAGATSVTIESAKPGIIIGRGGGDVDRLRKLLDKNMSGRVRVNVEETKNAETNAQLVAEEIAGQIERRASIRRAMGQAVERAIRAGAAGIRVQVSGRINGAEIARSERVGPEGSVPLHTLRADVSKGVSEAKTSYGNIGVQVLISNGLILPPRREEKAPEALEQPALEDAAAEEPVAEAVVAEAAPAEPVAEAVVAQPAPAEPVAEAVAEQAAPVEPAAEVVAEEAPAEEPAVEVTDEEPAAEEDAGDVDA